LPVVIVTGANSGIGRAACVQLAAAGAEVVMVCRNRERGEEARSSIALKTGREPALMLADLSLQSSIRAFVESFRRRYSRLDVLINNAAAFDASLARRTLTAEGFEAVFATNHLGPFLLTSLLVDMLRASAPARILNVSSEGLLMFPRLRLEPDNLNGERRYSRTHAYYRSKLAQVMFTVEAAERLCNSGVTANCIRVTNVALADDRVRTFPWYARAAYSIKRRFSIAPERMAEAYVRLAVAPGFADITGKHFDHNCREVPIPAGAQDAAARKLLWRLCEEMTIAPAWE
jgi:retinol dehydrogenase-14